MRATRAEFLRFIAIEGSISALIPRLSDIERLM